MYWYILVCNGLCWYVQVWNMESCQEDCVIHKVVGQYCQFPDVCSGILVHTSTYLYVLVKTDS